LQLFSIAFLQRCYKADCFRHNIPVVGNMYYLQTTKINRQYGIRDSNAEGNFKLLRIW